jgi:hypothetical protein
MSFVSSASAGHFVVGSAVRAGYAGVVVYDVGEEISLRGYMHAVVSFLVRPAGLFPGHKTVFRCPSHMEPQASSTCECSSPTSNHEVLCALSHRKGFMLPNRTHRTRTLCRQIKLKVMVLVDKNDPQEHTSVPYGPSRTADRIGPTSTIQSSPHFRRTTKIQSDPVGGCQGLGKTAVDWMLSKVAGVCNL